MAIIVSNKLESRSETPHIVIASTRFPSLRESLYTFEDLDAFKKTLQEKVASLKTEEENLIKISEIVNETKKELRV